MSTVARGQLTWEPGPSSTMWLSGVKEVRLNLEHLPGDLSCWLHHLLKRKHLTSTAVFFLLLVKKTMPLNSPLTHVFLSFQPIDFLHCLSPSKLSIFLIFPVVSKGKIWVSAHFPPFFLLFIAIYYMCSIKPDAYFSAQA